MLSLHNTLNLSQKEKSCLLFPPNFRTDQHHTSINLQDSITQKVRVIIVYHSPDCTFLILFYFLIIVKQLLAHAKHVQVVA